jgi:hypothetical protein
MPDDIRDLWQKQELEHMTITLDEIRDRAGTFRRRIVWRNLREYAAGAVAIAFFVPMLWRNHGWHLAPPILLISGTLCVLYQLHKRAGAPAGLAESGLRASLAWYRRELERQRDALREVWLWYLLPIVPGVLAQSVDLPWKRGFSLRYLASLVFVLLVLVGIWALNLHAARRLDRKIEEIRLMEQKDE